MGDHGETDKATCGDTVRTPVRMWVKMAVGMEWRTVVGREVRTPMEIWASIPIKGWRTVWGGGEG